MREYLKSLNLDPKTIDEIMAQVGKSFQNLKKVADGYKTKVQEYEAKMNELNSTIEKNNKDLENLQSITQENADLKADITMTGANTRPEFRKFVRSEVMASVNDETDFETALGNYKKENPQYFGDAQVRKVQSSPNLQGGAQPRTTNDIMNDLLRK